MTFSLFSAFTRVGSQDDVWKDTHADTILDELTHFGQLAAFLGISANFFFKKASMSSIYDIAVRPIFKNTPLKHLSGRKNIKMECIM